MEGKEWIMIYAIIIFFIIIFVKYKINEYTENRIYLIEQDDSLERTAQDFINTINIDKESIKKYLDPEYKIEII